MLTLCAALVMAVGLNAQTVDEVNGKYNEAADLIGGGKLVESIPLLEEVISMGAAAGPEAAESVNNAKKYLGQVLLRKGGGEAKAGNFEDAAVSLAKAAEVGEKYNDPTVMMQAKAMLSKVYLALGGTAFNDKEYAKAVEIFAKGYEVNPNDTDLALNLAMSYSELGATDPPMAEKGVEVYKNIIALGETNSKFKEAAATAKVKVVYYKKLAASELGQEKKFEEMLAVAKQILEIDPENSDGHLLQLQAANNMKNYDAVISFGEASASVQPTAENKSDAYFLLGTAYQNKENKAKAIEMYRKVTAGKNVATAKAQIAVLSK